MSREEDKEELVREYQDTFASRHVRGEEAYEFNIKIQKLDIPEIVRHTGTRDNLEFNVEELMEERLREFVEALESRFHWIRRWSRAGRSGGWLVLEPDEPLFTAADEVTVRMLEKRIKDLRTIDELLKKAKAKLKRDAASKDFWGIGPTDWSPRASGRRQPPTMGGLFDFLKKKEPESRALRPVEMTPIPGGGLIPAGPESAFDLLLPTSEQARAPMLPSMPVSSEMTVASPFDILEAPAPAPLYQARQAMPPASAPLRAWIQPTADEMASRLLLLLDVQDLFSRVRSARKNEAFRRELSRTRFTGSPAIIPLVPITRGDDTRDLGHFFGIPEAVLRKYSDEDIWNAIFWPLFDTVSEAFEILKPADLPGWFAVEHDSEADEWWLVYLEV